MRSIAFVLLFSLSALAVPSKLWGLKGDNWEPSGRLPDFSYAGYACGERPIPDVPVLVNVREFGATGDGKSDDSAAFLAAIESLGKSGKAGALLIPAGRYRISEILEITRSGVVLRGEGSRKSILVFSKPLNDIRPNMGATTGGRPTSNYSWSGGLVWFKGRNKGKDIGRVTETAARGAREIVLAKPSKLKPGDWIELSQRDDAEKSLIRHLYSGDPGDIAKIRPSSHSTKFVTRVSAVDGRRLSLERPLRCDYRPQWKAQVRRYEPSVSTSGIEALGFEFPARSYQGHFTELGFNAVAFNGVAHCWARDLRIVNADSGIFASGEFCTFSDLHFVLDGATPQPKQRVFGHHGITMNGQDNLLTRFHIDQRFVHDITVTGGAGNVASAGRGVDLCFDHHERAPYENLFTQLDLGKGSRMWKGGGGHALGRHCGAGGTFWNIQAEQPQKYPKDFGPASINLIGIETQEKAETSPKGRWFEPIPPTQLRPANLHQAQLKRRLER